MLLYFYVYYSSSIEEPESDLLFQGGGGAPPPPPPVAPPPPPPLSFQTAAVVNRLQRGPVPPVPTAGKLFGAATPLPTAASMSLKPSGRPSPKSTRVFDDRKQKITFEEHLLDTVRDGVQHQLPQSQKLEAMDFRGGVLIQYS